MIAQRKIRNDDDERLMPDMLERFKCNRMNDFKEIINIFFSQFVIVTIAKSTMSYSVTSLTMMMKNYYNFPMH